MKMKHILLLGVALSSPNGFVNPTLAQTTAFTYQGQLSAGGAPANGNYDLCFALYDAVTNGNAVGFPQTNSAVAVSNGLFGVTLDFGPIFTGTNYWLDISVCQTGGTNFTELSPRQPISPTPYAIFANSASNLLGNLPAGVVTNGASGVNISGTFNGDGAGMTNLNGMNLQPGTVPGSAIGSIDASQVNGLGTAATKDTANFVASTNGFAADLTIQSSSGNNLTIWATNSSSALYINGDYRNGINGDRYRALFAAGDPGLIDNGYITLDGNWNIDTYTIGNLACFTLGADTPDAMNILGVQGAPTTGTIMDNFYYQPTYNAYVNSAYPNGFETSRITEDGRIDSWNLDGYHDLNPRIVLHNDYVDSSALPYAFDVRANNLIIGPDLMPTNSAFYPGDNPSGYTNIIPGIIESINGYVAIGHTNYADVPAQALDVNGNVIASGVIAAASGFESFATNMAAIDATGWTNNFGVNAMVYVNGTAGQEVTVYDGSTTALFIDTLGHGTLPLELHPGWFFSGDNLSGTAVAE
jgi:hypothetical protein